TSLRSATSPSEEGEGQVCGGLALFAEESTKGSRSANLRARLRNRRSNPRSTRQNENVCKTIFIH
ncbi:MAG: hypothetical protein OXH87_09875, partial [Rhodospirillaceae bacterium]|nr:hypothetical protein [Rhodospirillaceae bacterium]